MLGRAREGTVMRIKRVDQDYQSFSAGQDFTQSVKAARAGLQGSRDEKYSKKVLLWTRKVAERAAMTARGLSKRLPECRTPLPRKKGRGFHREDSATQISLGKRSSKPTAGWAPWQAARWRKMLNSMDIYLNKGKRRLQVEEASMEKEVSKHKARTLLGVWKLPKTEEISIGKDKEVWSFCWGCSLVYWAWFCPSSILLLCNLPLFISFSYTHCSVLHSLYLSQCHQNWRLRRLKLWNLQHFH